MGKQDQQEMSIKTTLPLSQSSQDAGGAEAPVTWSYGGYAGGRSPGNQKLEGRLGTEPGFKESQRKLNDLQQRI